MKLSPLLCASFVALAALALTANGAFAKERSAFDEGGKGTKATAAGPEGCTMDQGASLRADIDKSRMHPCGKGKGSEITQPVGTVQPSFTQPVGTVQPSITQPVGTVQPSFTQPVGTVQPSITQPVGTVQPSFTGDGTASSLRPAGKGRNPQTGAIQIGGGSDGCTTDQGAGEQGLRPGVRFDIDKNKKTASNAHPCDNGKPVPDHAGNPNGPSTPDGN